MMQERTILESRLNGALKRLGVGLELDMEFLMDLEDSIENYRQALLRNTDGSQGSHSSRKGVFE